MSIEVSIITPAYNASKTIRETYDSIRNQTFTNWEWVVVNDCSKDNTRDVVLDIAKQDNRVILIDAPQNGGAAVARNLGIDAAKGKYIAFLDADDLWLSEKLEHQIKYMKDNNYAFTYTDYYVLFSSGKKKEYISKKSSVTYKELLHSCVIGCLTVMYDASMLGKNFMPLDAPKREDHAAWLDLVKKTGRAYKLKESLSIYRNGETGVSSKKFKMFKYQYRLYRKHEKFNPVKSLWYTLLVSFNKVFKKYL